MISIPMSDDRSLGSADEASEHGSDNARDSPHAGEFSALPATEVSQAGPSSGAEQPSEGTAVPGKAAKRLRKAPIDIDDHIATARQKMKEAQKMASAAKAQARNEKRKNRG